MKTIGMAGLAAGVVVMAVATSLYVLHRSGDTKVPLALDPDDPNVVERGAAIYSAQCAACHGARLEGQPDWRRRGANGRPPAPPHDETGHTWHHPDEVLVKITRHGPAALVGAPTSPTCRAMRRF